MIVPLPRFSFSARNARELATQGLEHNNRMRRISTRLMGSCYEKMAGLLATLGAETGVDTEPSRRGFKFRRIRQEIF